MGEHKSHFSLVLESLYEVIVFALLLSRNLVCLLNLGLGLGFRVSVVQVFEIAKIV